MPKQRDMNIMDMKEAQALSGRILATLNNSELALLHLLYERGRKQGIEVNISYPGFDPSDLPAQFKAVLMGDTNAPIWRENSVISVKKLT